MTEKKCIFNSIITSTKEKIKKAFGEPSEGIHSYRIFNIAYLDVIFTMVGAFFIQRLFFPKRKIYEVLFLISKWNIFTSFI